MRESETVALWVLPAPDRWGNYYLGGPGKLPALFKSGRRGPDRWFAMRADGSVVCEGGRIAYYQDTEVALWALEAYAHG